MAYSRLADAIWMDGREIDVARAVLLVAEMAFAFQQAQHAAHRGIRRRIREIAENLGCACFGAPIDDLHDLSFSPAELVETAILHRRDSFQGRTWRSQPSMSIH